MGATNDLYQLTDHQRLEGQEVINTYFYRLASATAGNSAEQLVSSWIDQILPGILDIQNNGLLHYAVSAKNLYNESEAWTELVSEEGAYGAGDTLPSFNAVGFRLVGDNAAVHDGQKRYAAVPEAAQDDSVITDTTYLDWLATVAGLLVAGLTVGLAPDVFVPIVVGRLLDGGSYRLPTNSGEAVVSNIIDALFNIDVTSQTSRKIGRGA